MKSIELQIAGFPKIKVSKTPVSHALKFQCSRPLTEEDLAMIYRYLYDEGFIDSVNSAIN
ncbi:MAG: hypothetical protein Q8O88_00600 [bacterium]|nr:hypothetical protein [bacterium]